MKNLIADKPCKDCDREAEPVSAACWNNLARLPVLHNAPNTALKGKLLGFITETPYFRVSNQGSYDTTKPQAT